MLAWRNIWNVSHGKMPEQFLKSERICWNWTPTTDREMKNVTCVESEKQQSTYSNVKEDQMTNWHQKTTTICSERDEWGRPQKRQFGKNKRDSWSNQESYGKKISNKANYQQIWMRDNNLHSRGVSGSGSKFQPITITFPQNFLGLPLRVMFIITLTYLHTTCE